jgi:predicted XRE-type DNA-binding protein
VARFKDAVYVLHAFEKKTKKTRQADIEVGRQRLAAVLKAERQSEQAMGKRIRRSSGDVFRELGLAPEEAETLRVRSELMIELSKVVEKRGLTQAEAADLFGVTQPRVSDLVRGKIERFSVDALIAMLGRAGIRVVFTTKRRGRVA